MWSVREAVVALATVSLSQAEAKIPCQTVLAPEKITFSPGTSVRSFAAHNGRLSLVLKSGTEVKLHANATGSFTKAVDGANADFTFILADKTYLVRNTPATNTTAGKIQLATVTNKAITYVDGPLGQAHGVAEMNNEIYFGGEDERHKGTLFKGSDLTKPATWTKLTATSGPFRYVSAKGGKVVATTGSGSKEKSVQILEDERFRATSKSKHYDDVLLLNGALLISDAKVSSVTRSTDLLTDKDKAKTVYPDDLFLRMYSLPVGNEKVTFVRANPTQGSREYRLYASFDSGETWEKVMKSDEVLHFAFDQATQMLYVLSKEKFVSKADLYTIKCLSGTSTTGAPGKPQGPSSPLLTTGPPSNAHIVTASPFVAFMLVFTVLSVA